ASVTIGLVTVVTLFTGVQMVVAAEGAIYTALVVTFTRYGHRTWRVAGLTRCVADDAVPPPWWDGRIVGARVCVIGVAIVAGLTIVNVTITANRAVGSAR